MSELDVHGDFRPSLIANAPASAVMAKCLELQSQARPLSRWQRFTGRSPLAPLAWSWYTGALGELEAGRILTALGPGWTVLHAVPVGDADTDIDHVVIGPTGVFTINTKHHQGADVWAGGGTISVNRRPTKYAPSALYEAKRAARLLTAAVNHPIPVTPAIAVVGATRIHFGTTAPRVDVLRAEQLIPWLADRPRAFTPAQAAVVAAAAAERSTWQTTPQVSTDPWSSPLRFQELVTAVESAKSRRRRLGRVVILGIVCAPLLVIAGCIASIAGTLSTVH